MTRHIVAGTLGLALVFACGARRAGAQGPTEAGTPGGLGSAGESRMEPAPGSGGAPSGDTQGRGAGILGGRPGPSAPRVPQGITRPGADAPERPGGRGLGPIPDVPRAEPVAAGPLEVPAGGEDEGPPDGLTLDRAIERLVRSNLDLCARSFELPQAQADILTAGLRANPLLYFDAQLIPYGGFPTDRPGGQTQYDLNLNYPIDVTHKRRARTAVACQAKRVLEAQYQDAVRQAIDNLYTAFVDALAARETVRFARASVKGLDNALELIRAQEKLGAKTLADVGQIKVQRDIAQVTLLETEEAIRDTKRALAVLLNLPTTGVESLEVRGTIRDVYPPPPAVEVLVGSALASRPDLVAYRLGLRRAEADVRLARANRLEDVFLLVQPLTIQDNPSNRKDAASWAVGVTIPLPIYNRNQGNIARARINVTQTQVELAELERRVIAEVQQAERAYAVTHEAEQRFERDILQEARQGRDTIFRLYIAGERDLSDYLVAQREYNEVVRQYRDTLVRHRRSMLQINTAVGQRIFP